MGHDVSPTLVRMEKLKQGIEQEGSAMLKALANTTHHLMVPRKIPFPLDCDCDAPQSYYACCKITNSYMTCVSVY